MSLRRDMSKASYKQLYEWNWIRRTIS